MDNLLDYVMRVGDVRFDALAPGEVDLACFSQLAYLPYDIAFSRVQRPTLEQAGELMAEVEADKLYNVFFRKRLELMRAMMQLPRYRGIVLCHYVKDIDPTTQKQFCALSFVLPDGRCVISFEGTDITLVGWKEDFNMSFESPVPAQEAARDYLHRIAQQEPMAPLLLTGHSKGGNLAVWAAAFAQPQVQARIEGVYSFDGPGLMDKDADSPGYAAVAQRIHACLPQDSLVGVLMRRHVPGIVVKSHAFSLMQHDLFTWEVEAEGPNFVHLPDLSRTARVRDETLSEWLTGLSLEQRESFCEAVYKVLSADESRETLLDLVRPDLDLAGRSLRALLEIDPQTRKMMRQALHQLVLGGVDNMLDAAKEAVMDILPLAKGGEDEAPASQDKAPSSKN